MDSFASPHEVSVVDRLARWLAAACVFYAVCSIAQETMLLLHNGWTMYRPPGRRPSLDFGLQVLNAGTNVLLLVSGIALWSRRRWAHPMLLVYAWLTLGMTVLAVISFSGFQWPQMRRSWAASGFSTSQQVAYLGLGLVQIVKGVLFPAIVLVCLTRLGVGKCSPASSRGFQPVTLIER